MFCATIKRDSVSLLGFSLLNHIQIIMLLPETFSHQFLLMVFHWSLIDCKSFQVSKTLLRILADLDNAVVWMISICPPTSNSFSPFINSLVSVPRAPITIGINVTFMFHSFFQFPSKVHVLILLFPLFKYYSVVSRDSKLHNPLSSLFFFC